MKKNIIRFLFAAVCTAVLWQYTGCRDNADIDDTTSYANPITDYEADPWIYHHTDGYFYYTATYSDFDRIIIRKAETINLLRTASETDLLTANSGILAGTAYEYIWAPELHYINGVWYLFFSASTSSSSDWTIRQFAAECTDSDPVEGTWELKGQIGSSIINTFSVDGTVFKVNNQWYYVWSQYIFDGGTYDEDGDSSNDSVTVNGTVYSDVAGNSTGWACLFIAKTTSDDFTTITDPTIVSVPQYDWECGQDTSICTHTSANVNVNEGPAVLNRNGKVFIVYSASGCDESYCMGMLTADEDDDLCDMSSWSKSGSPVFTTSVTNSVYGPGHCSFTTDGDYDVIVYHARRYAGLYDSTSANLDDTTTDGLSDPNRSARAKVFTWNSDGTPNFGTAE
ncbi:MAG TPA: alpha-N-arabinofuranosidase [Treponema sp.]|nr:alpha-N-arabinofuranosidase [Treponema sp.]